MDKLTKTQQEGIRKMSTERLRVRLIGAGQDEETVCGTDRPELLTMWAELVATGRDKPITGVQPSVASAAAADPETEKSRAEAEQLRFRQQAEKLTLKATEIAQKEQEMKMRAEENAFKIAESKRLETGGG